MQLVPQGKAPRRGLALAALSALLLAGACTLPPDDRGGYWYGPAWGGGVVIGSPWYHYPHYRHRKHRHYHHRHPHGRPGYGHPGPPHAYPRPRDPDHGRPATISREERERRAAEVRQRRSAEDALGRNASEEARRRYEERFGRPEPRRRLGEREQWPAGDQRRETN